MYIIALFYLVQSYKKNCDLTKSLLEKVGILFVFYVHNAYYHTKRVCQAILTHPLYSIGELCSHRGRGNVQFT